MGNNSIGTSHFFEYIVERGFSLACIQDAYLYNNKPKGLKKTMTCYSSSSNNCHIVIIDPQLNHCLAEKQNSSILVNVNLNNISLTIGSFYCPPSRDLETDLPFWPSHYFQKINFLYMGDFNAHSPLWGYSREDTRGRLLTEFVTTYRLIILNDPQCLPTYESLDSRQQGRPDLSLSSQSLFPYLSNWEVSRDLIFSDHRHITINIDIRIPPLPRRRYKTKNVPKTKFISGLLSSIKNHNIDFNTVKNKPEFDQTYDKFYNELILNCNKHFKTKKSFAKPRLSWWTPELRSQRNKVKALYRKTKLTYATSEDLITYKRERALLQKSINEARKLSWDNLCRRESNPFGTIKNLAFQNSLDTRVDFVPSTIPGLFNSRVDSLWHLTEQLFGPDSVSPLTSAGQHTPVQLENKFTKRELRKVIFSFNPNKAPGPDAIDHHILRALFTGLSDVLLQMFNTLLDLNYFPTAWKKGELVYFKKEGKPDGIASSYRPITLLPILGKVFEKLVLKRLNYHLAQNIHFLSGFQHGFRELRSTETALLSAISRIKLNKQNNNYTSLISLDFKGAFDNLNWDLSIQSLNKLGLNAQLKNIISSFLSNRRALVDRLSPDVLYSFSRGCPQGSCLGPFLWLALLETLLSSFSFEGCAMVAYADDVLLIVWGPSRAQLELRGNTALAYIQNWAQTNKIEISYEKSMAIHFGKPAKLKRPPIYRLLQGNIKSVSSINYLGVTIDNALSFQPHLKNKRLSIFKTTQNLFKFTSIFGRLRNNIFKTWYKTILQRQLAYACAVWHPHMWPSHGNRHILSIQRNVMLLISRAWRNTSTNALQLLTGLPPLDLQIAAEAQYAGVIRHGISTEEFFAPLFHYKNSKHLIDPTWDGIPLTKLEAFKGNIFIFTDGSKTDNHVGSAYCAFQDRTLLHEWEAQLGSENSVFQAELFAIKNAIIWMEKQPFAEILICSDSLSGLLSLDNIEHTDPLVQDIQLSVIKSSKLISFMWIKGHSGIHGNERADTLARNAAVNDSLPPTFVPYPPSNLKYTLKQKLLLDWQLRWDYSLTGRYTYQFFPKVSQQQLLNNRYLFLFATNHGPFQQHRYQIDVSPSPNCICGETSDSLHYVLSCPLTSTFHIKKHQNQTLSQWLNYIIGTPTLLRRLIDCMRFVEINSYIFEDVAAPLVPP